MAVLSYFNKYVNFHRKYLIFLLSILTSCATSALTLPSDTTSINKEHDLAYSDFVSSDLALKCSAIQKEYDNNASIIHDENEVILANRKRNEVAGYFGALLIVPLAATESNSSEKATIAKLNKRQDILIKLMAFKRCSQNTR